MSCPFARALTAAVAIHIALVGGALFWERSRPPVTVSVPPGVQPWLDLDVSLVPTAEPSVPPSVTESPAPGIVRSEGPGRMAMLVPRSDPGQPNPVDAAGDGAGNNTNDVSGGDPIGIPGGRPGGGGGAGQDGEARAPVNLGLDRGLTWMWTSPDRAPPKPRPASTTGGLQEALDAHDRKAGLGFGGPVVTAFHAVAAHPSAPQTGSARFEAIIDASGRVTDVHVLSVDGEMEKWLAVARQVLAALRSRVLRTPLGGQGVAVVVAVQSRHQLPSGAAPGRAIEMKGAGAQFDLSDIGARPTHNVAVRVLSERRL